MRTVLRIAFGLLVAVVVIVIPLLVVQRAECRRGDRIDDEWSVAIPFEQERRRRDCRKPESGAEQLLEFVRSR